MPLDKSFATVYRPYFGTVVYVVNVPPAVNKVLLASGIYKGNIIHGDWPLVQRATIRSALGGFPDDSGRIDAGFPYTWDAPAERPTREGADSVGADGRAWQSFRRDKNKQGLKWIRSQPAGPLDRRASVDGHTTPP